MTKARTLADNFAADINGITAGTGITGGGTSGTVTITNDMATTIAAKGDLVAGTANDAYAALTVGANDTVLTADSSTATGLKWATPSSGGMTLLSTTNLSGSTSITVSNISQDYTNLFILLNNAVKPNGTGDQEYYVIPNNTTNAAGTVREANTGTSFQADNIKFANSSPQTDQPRTYFLTIHNYASTTAYKTFIGGGIQRNADNTQWEGVSVTGGLQSTSAITSLVVSSGATNWSGGQLLIYGVK